MLSSLVETLSVLDEDITVVEKVVEAIAEQRDGRREVAKSAQPRTLLQDILEIVLHRKTHVDCDILWGERVDAKHGLSESPTVVFIAGITFPGPAAGW
jgi:hypothetical protein